MFRGITTPDFRFEGMPRYWTSGNQAEVDFLIQVKNDIIPIEVKSDENIRSKSLAVYNELYQPPVRIRYSLKNLKIDDGLLNIPLFIAELHRKASYPHFKNPLIFSTICGAASSNARCPAFNNSNSLNGKSLLEASASATVKRKIIFPADHQHARPVLLQPVLPGRKKNDLRPIVFEKIDLDPGLSGRASSIFICRSIRKPLPCITTFWTMIELTSIRWLVISRIPIGPP